MHLKALCKPLLLPNANRGILTKTLLIMKFTAILLLAAALQVSAKSYSQQITLSVKDVPLEQVFKAIQSQTGYSFVYNNRLMKGTKNVSLQVDKTSIEEVLQICFKSQPLTYTVIDKTIVVKPREVIKPDEAAVAPAPPPIDVSGKIVNEKGEPAAGVSVSVKGTNKATATDAGGNFLLSGIDSKAVLVISGANIETLETSINGRTTLDVTVRQKLSELTEVVVNKGYYTESKALSTGSIGTVTAKTIQQQPVSNPLAALVGRIAGLDVTQQSGVAGANFTIRIRGTNSVRGNLANSGNANDPLVLVDGIPFLSSPTNVNTTGNGIRSLSPLNALDPSDIQSIEVLKDADATAIYGSRGSNGIILITTKRGRAGKTQFNMNLSSGIGGIARKADVLNGPEYLAMRHQAIKNAGTPYNAGIYDFDLNQFDTTTFYDWQKILIGGTARYNNAQLSLSGGTENNRFTASLGYLKQTSVYPTSAADQRVNTQLAFDHTSSDKRFKANLTMTMGVENNNMPTEDLVDWALTLPPVYFPLKNDNGSYKWFAPFPGLFVNPLARLTRTSDSKTSVLTANGVFGYDIIESLTVKTLVGYNRTDYTGVTLVPSTYYEPGTVGTFIRSNNTLNTNNNTWNMEPQISYTRILGPGSISALLGATFQQTVQNAYGIYAYNFSNDNLIGNPANAPLVQAGTTNLVYKYNALFGRLNYNIADKYILNLTARRDGSSRFGPGKQFGNFGAAGAAWIFSEEKFVKQHLRFLNFGKLRASYGVTGNDQIGDYNYLTTYYATSLPYGTPPSYGGNGVLNPERLANPDLAWETNKKLDLALELGLFKNRVSVSATWFRNRTSNQLVNYPLPAITGFSSILLNSPAVVQNTGIELELSTVNIKTTAFSWSTSTNLTIPRNKLVSFDNLASSPYATAYVVGQPLTVQTVFDFAGVDPKTGANTWRNAAGTIVPAKTLTLTDRAKYVNAGKEFYGGINNNFTWKGLSLDIFLQFVKQVGRSTNVSAFQPFIGTWGWIVNEPTKLYERSWKQSGDITNYHAFVSDPLQSTAVTPSVINSSYDPNYYADNSFIRIKNIALSYTLPQPWVQKARMQNLRIYMQAQNLFTFSNYMGLDPENQSTSLPPLRIITAGIQATF